MDSLQPALGAPGLGSSWPTSPPATYLSDPPTTLFSSLCTGLCPVSLCFFSFLSVRSQLTSEVTAKRLHTQRQKQTPGSMTSKYLTLGDGLLILNPVSSSIKWE